MTILYEGIGGSAPVVVLAVFAWVIAGTLIAFTIWDVVGSKEFGFEDLGCVILAVFLIFGGFNVNQDRRYKEVKAIINDTVSFEEINKKYELIKQEGELYTFKVREDGK